MKLDFCYENEEQLNQLDRVVKAMLIKHFQGHMYYVVSSRFASYNGPSIRIELDPQEYFNDMEKAKQKLRDKTSEFMTDFMSDILTHINFPPRIFVNDWYLVNYLGLQNLDFIL